MPEDDTEAVLGFEGGIITTLSLPVPPKARAKATGLTGRIALPWFLHGVGVSIFGALGVPDMKTLLETRKKLAKSATVEKVCYAGSKDAQNKCTYV